MIHLIIFVVILDNTIFNVDYNTLEICLNCIWDTLTCIHEKVYPYSLINL